MKTILKSLMKQKTFIFILSIVIMSSCELSSQTARDNMVKPERLMDMLDIRPGMQIGEAGAGSGYLTLYLAKRVGNKGRIYANDIDPGPLERLRSKAERENIDNITCVIGESNDPMFPENDLDLIIMLHSFHEFENHVKWLRNTKKYLGSGGRVVILDAWFDDGRTMTKEFIEGVASQSGYVLDMYDPYLRNVHVFVLKIED